MCRRFLHDIEHRFFHFIRFEINRLRLFHTISYRIRLNRATTICLAVMARVWHGTLYSLSLFDEWGEPSRRSGSDSDDALSGVLEKIALRDRIQSGETLLGDRQVVVGEWR